MHVAAHSLARHLLEEPAVESDGCDKLAHGLALGRFDLRGEPARLIGVTVGVTVGVNGRC